MTFQAGLKALRVCGICVTLFAAPSRAEPPKVVSLDPPNDAVDVDPNLTELRVTFDQDMSNTGYSLCGGGPTFPAIEGRPTWKDARTLIVKVKLEPDHSYSMSLNCPAAGNFRSASGEPLEPTPWSFSTASKRKLVNQRKLNEKSLNELMTALRDRYSYYDRLGLDWDALLKKHRKKILSAKSTRAWATRTADMLAAAKDLHLWMKYKDASIGTFKRRVAPNMDIEGVKKVLPEVSRRSAFAWVGRTDDDIGYILIPSWSAELRAEADGLQSILEEMQDRKALVIDVRPNSGGDELLARDVAAWFVEGDKIYSKNCYRDVNAAGGFGQVFDRVIAGNKPPRQFTKPVAVLMGIANMSSCESFLLMMREGRDVTLVGAKTFGSSGNPRLFALANGVQVFIPSWKDMLPDGTVLEGKGVSPDVHVKSKGADFKSGDPVLERALQILRKKSKRS